MIEIFKRYGQPKAIKVDNGRPFGDPGSDLLPVMALWLIGLGIEVIHNRPRQPTDNAKVERMQAVTGAWAEPHSCKTIDELSQRLELTALLQRQQYQCRRLGNRTRAEVYPDLLLPSRSAYRPESFDHEAIRTLLATGRWVRRVSKAGQIDFYHQRIGVGAAYRYQRVEVHLDLARNEWIVSTASKEAITSFASDFLAAENIQRLSLQQVRPTRQNFEAHPSPDP